MNKTIRFFDGITQDQPIIGEIKHAINSVINRGIFVDGIETKKFEEEWAAENGVKYCVLTANGTSALEIALRSVDVGVNCPIQTTANSFFATSSCIQTVGEKVDFVDTDETCNIDIDKCLESNFIGSIIGVNLYGNPLNHEKLLKKSQEKEVPLILDLAQSHYTKYKGKNPAEFCDIGCFSFYVTKTLGSFGECGCIVTNSKKIEGIAKNLRNHGRSQDGYFHILNSGNLRGDEIQAAVLRVKNKFKDYYIEGRLKIAARYKENFKSYSHILLKENSDATRLVNYVFPIFVEKRDELKEFLAANGISTIIHYPISLPDQPVYENAFGSFPNAQRQCAQTLSLPFFVGLKDDEIDYVCEKVIEFLEKS